MVFFVCFLFAFIFRVALVLIFCQRTAGAVGDGDSGRPDFAVTGIGSFGQPDVTDDLDQAYLEMELL